MADATFPTRRLQSDGLTIPYLISGDGPLLVLSYILGTIVWGDVAALARSCTVAVIDPREPSASDLWTLGRYEWLPDLASELGFETAALATWSLGAPAALRYAAGHPPVLSRLVLVEPAGLNPGALPTLRPIDNPAPDQVRDMVRLMWRGWVHSEALDTAALQEEHVHLLTSPALFEANASANRAASDSMLFDAFESVAVPTLLLAGRHSRVFGPAAADRIAAQLPQSTTVIFEDSSHALQLEQPSLFAQTVSDFLVT